jgi:protein-disulfide isomerase
VNPKARGKSPLARFYGILALVGIVGIAAIAYLATRPKNVARDIDPNVPAGEAKGYLLGSATAPVTIVEFADFECPACGNFATITEPDVRARLVNTGKANFRFYDLPLEIHKNTWQASHAAACANDQGKFWEMHDRLFAGQHEWNGEVTSNPTKVHRGYAKELGLDVDKWESCVKSGTHQRAIAANRAEAIRLNVGSTPTFVIGGKMIPGSLPYDQIARLVDEAAKQAPAAAPAGAGDAPRSTPVPAGGARPGR